MSDKGLVSGLPKIDNPMQLCDGCLVGKHARSPFPASAKLRAEKKLQLVHADICGPIAPSTPAGNKYFLLLVDVDDFSRMMWVYVIKAKSDAFETFQKFKAQVENECDQRHY